MTEPHPLSMSALIARRDEHRNAGRVPVPPSDDAVPPAIPKPWTATGRTREAGRTLDMATGRPVPRIEREYSRDGVTVWTSNAEHPPHERQGRRIQPSL